MRAKHHFSTSPDPLQLELGFSVPLPKEEGNVALIAGAGAGKTYGLVTRCLQLLAGARAAGAPLHPSRLYMLTFTDKAAAEMRQRLRQRVDQLARGEAADDPKLAVPRLNIWRSVRESLSAATVGTFHSLCAQLLREVAASRAENPVFEILEERDAQELMRGAAERLVLEYLEQKNAGVIALCRSVDFASGPFYLGLIDSLCNVVRRLREEGLPPQGVLIANADQCRAEFERGLLSVRAAVDQVAALDWIRLYTPLVSACRRALEGMTIENFLESDRFPRLERVLRSELDLAKAKNPVKDALRRLRQGVLGDGNGEHSLADLFGAWAVVPCEEAFRKLLADLESRYRTELRRRGALDFSELLIRTRDLLRDDLPTRRRAQERIGALLVDEFQDTNSLQLEIVTLLSEKRAGGPRPVSGSKDSVLSLPFEQSFLCAVGDRKQSIYEFRGADVAVFGQIAAKIEREGGSRQFLRENRRSSPALLKFFNAAFARLMRPLATVRDYEVDYQPKEDDQRPVRAQVHEEPCIDWLLFDTPETAEECRQKEAQAVARRIAQILSSSDASGSPSIRAPIVPSSAKRVSRDATGDCRTRAGDIAILFRRFTFLAVYRQALMALGIPHRVVRGRGFYGAQEVMDLASLLRLIADPNDTLAFAAVLRSPWVALSDSSLFKVCSPLPAGEGPSTLRQAQGSGHGQGEGAPNLASQAETDRLNRFRHVYRELRRERDRLGLRALLKVALEELGFKVALSGMPFGEQAVANVDRVLEIAGRWDASGNADPHSFANYLLALTDAEPYEAQPELDTEDAQAVQLLTIHQAKGLEWPIVAIVDLAAQRPHPTGRVLFDRRLGLAIRPTLPDELESRRSPRVQQIFSELNRREDAEYLRLLYVALTRAKDWLILSGQAPRAGNNWREMLADVIQSEPSLSDLVLKIRLEDLPARPFSPSGVGPEFRGTYAEQLDLAVNRARHPRPVMPAGAVFPVTHLQDYFLCPRRYFYARHLGLLEFPLVFEFDTAVSDEADGHPRDRRLQGTLAHRVLEKVDLRLVKEPALRAHVESLLWAEGVDPTSSDALEIAQWVLGFLSSPFASRMAQRPLAAHRELPFLLTLGPKEGFPAIHLKGQIDLLFEEEDGSATVVDYKASMRHPSGLSPYAFQLDCYALAARRFVRPGVPIRTGIAFLREPNAEPQMRQIETVGSESFEERLIRGATELIRFSTDSLATGQEWPGLPKERCVEIACGYQYRCHAD